MPCETNKQSYLDSYNVVVDEIKQLQPTLSTHDVSVEAAQRFRPIHAYLQEATKVENSGAEKYQNGEFIMVGGKMFFPATGETAESLHEKQLRSSQLQNKPEKYSRVDHETTLLIQEHIANGATVVRTSFNREDGLYRDMVEYQYDPKTNRGKIIVHDLSKQNGLLNESRMKQIVFQESQGLRAVVQSEKVFVLTDASTSLSHRIEKVVRAPETIGFINEGLARKIYPYEPRAAQRREETVPSDRVIKNTQETIRYVRRRVIADAKETVQSVRRWVAAKRTEAPAFMFTREFAKRNEKQEPQSVKEIVIAHGARVRRQRRELIFIEKTGVARAAIPLVLQTVSETPPKMVLAVEKSMRRHEKRELRRKKRRATENFIKVQQWKTGKIEHLRIRKKEKQRKKLERRRSGGEVVSKQISRKVHREIVREWSGWVERRKKKLGLEKSVDKKAIARRELKLATTRTPAKERRRGQRRELASQESVLRSWERSVLRRVRFVWLLYRYLYAERNRRGPEERRDNLKRLAAYGGSPWILLSIIWYLTIIREQGRQTVKGKRKKAIPQQAVIFAFQ